MALELLAVNDCFPLIDRVRVTTGQSDTAPFSDLGGALTLVEGRGLLCSGSGGRYVVQPDGGAARIGLGRFGPNLNSIPVLCALGGRRWYAEVERYPSSNSAVTTRRAHLLNALTLQGFEDVADAPPGDSPHATSVLLPDGTWMAVGITVAGAVQYRIGTAWVTQAALPFFGAAFASWGDDADDVWFANSTGEAAVYNLRTRTVSRHVRTGVSNFGLFYWPKHRVFVSLHSGPRVRVWATTPRPTQLVQTVLPAPRAGRVSRVTTRLLGSYNEPCAGERVRWTAPSGYQLVPVQDVTGDDGAALADLIVPMGATGSGEVLAEVVI